MRFLMIFGLVMLSGLAWAADFDAELAAVQHEWAIANYRVPEGKARKEAFEAVADKARALGEAWPDRPEARVWEGIVLSTYAGVKGGLGALKLAKQARAALEAAEAMDPGVLQGSVYTSLGTLYHKVPGGLIGFGDEDKARAYLRKALEMNPDGIDPNYFYAEFLMEEEGDYRGAIAHLERALRAPDRPGRPVADEGRRMEARALLEKARERA